MHPKKAYEAKIRQLEQRIAKIEAQKKGYQLKLSGIRKEFKYAKQRTKELERSRATWKEKSKANNLKIKGLRRCLYRREKAKRHFYPLLLIQLCILLRVVGQCSYEGGQRILNILSFLKLVDYTQLPCANTIQNWVAKVGLYELQTTEHQLAGQEVVLLVDESIRIGRDKQLLVLSTPYEKVKEEALGFQDVNVLYFGGRTSWTGDGIADVWKDLEQRMGFKVRAL